MLSLLISISYSTYHNIVMYLSYDLVVNLNRIMENSFSVLFYENSSLGILHDIDT